MFDYETFRVNLVLKRKALKVTQEDIANYADISEKNLSKIEKAKQEPNLPTVIGILNFFNSSVSQFMEQDNHNIEQALINKIKDYTCHFSKTEKEFLLELIKDFRKDIQ